MHGRVSGAAPFVVLAVVGAAPPGRPPFTLARLPMGSRSGYREGKRTGEERTRSQPEYKSFKCWWKGGHCGHQLRPRPPLPSRTPSTGRPLLYPAEAWPERPELSRVGQGQRRRRVAEDAIGGRGG